MPHAHRRTNFGAAIRGTHDESVANSFGSCRAH
jgi:hypothetical protein